MSQGQAANPYEDTQNSLRRPAQSIIDKVVTAELQSNTYEGNSKEVDETTADKRLKQSFKDKEFI